MPVGIKWHVEHILVSDSDNRHSLRGSVCDEIISAVLHAQNDAGNQPKAEHY